MADIFIDPLEPATELHAVATPDLPRWAAQRDPEIRSWVECSGFSAAAHSSLRVPGPRPAVVVGLGNGWDRWSLAHLPFDLPEGPYRLATTPPPQLLPLVCLGWALGAYRYARYTDSQRQPARLCWPEGVDRRAVLRDARAVSFARDLINTPANDMGPAELSDAAAGLATGHGASLRVVQGDDLLREGYPLVHAVGRASSREPRLLDLRWGRETDRKVTVLGKGVCFDSGGLNLKSFSSMYLMKKDMGGAAHAFALADMIMGARLPMRLRVIVPAVENAVAGNAMRPLDVLRARNGLTVEIGNTDSEGRLILADALADASAESPDLLIDFATLTSAATMALGPDLPALFCNDEETAAALDTAAAETQDPLWRLPLWQPYVDELKGKVAHLTNKPAEAWTAAAAIYAALFLQHFITPGARWVHIDTLGWNPKSKPGRPEGGEARNLLALFSLLRSRFAAAG